MLFKVDDFLIDDVLEPFYQWTQKTIGLSCFMVAKGLFVLALLCFIGWILYLMMIDFLLVFLILFQAVDRIMNLVMHMIIAGKKEEELEGGSQGKAKNPMRFNLKLKRVGLIIQAIIFVPLNISLSIFFPWSPIFKLLIVFIIVEIVGYYSISCTPIPPQKSWVKRWLESWIMTPAISGV